MSTSRKAAPVSLFSPKFLVILSTRWANCKGILCLGWNPNPSSRFSLRSLTSHKILVNRIFSNNLPTIQETNGPIGWGQCRTLPRFKDRNYPSVLPYCRKVMSAENRIENLGQEGYRSLGKILQGPVQCWLSVWESPPPFIMCSSWSACSAG